MRPRLLDLFCGAGGAAMGYHKAGFDVVGVDIAAQPRFPFQFVQADATVYPLAGFDAIHASPPCQRYSNAQRLRGNDHPDFVPVMRERLAASGVPWVMENVRGAPLLNPFVLCGAMFGLKTYRHRLFESGELILTPPHPEHAARQAKMGRQPKAGEYIQAIGNFSGVWFAREAMGVDWMVRDEIAECIPPAYTEHIGHQLIATLGLRMAA